MMKGIDMIDILQKLKERQDLFLGNGVTEDSIVQAQEKLGLIFSNEYYQYLKIFAIVATNGHELTGICKSSRLNVVDVTIIERENNPTVPKNWYVIEQANIDGIVIWQAETGEIYQTAPNAVPLKLYDSLGEYIEM